MRALPPCGRGYAPGAVCVEVHVLAGGSLARFTLVWPAGGGRLCPETLNLRTNPGTPNWRGNDLVVNRKQILVLSGPLCRQAV